MERETILKIFDFLEEKEGKEIPEALVDSIKNYKLIKELIKKLETYPDGTQYRHEDHLELNNSNIKKLPNDLYVEGALDLTNCKQLRGLPDKLHVDGPLVLRDCNQLRGLPDNLYVGGYLDLRGCQYLTELTDNLYVKGSLGLGGTNITELPNNLYVGINLFINNTPLAKNYTDDEIRDIVKLPMNDGIKGQIIR